MKGLEFSRTYPEREFVRQGGFGEINPIRKIPVLVVDGIPVPETEVICELIEDIFPEPSLRPDDALDRSRARLLSRIVDVYLTGPLVQLSNNVREMQSEDIAAQATSMVDRGLPALERWIAPGPYAVGDQRSTADCAIAPTLFFMKSILPAFGIGKLSDLGPKTTRYFEAVQKDRDVGHCLARMEGSLQERMAQARG